MMRRESRVTTDEVKHLNAGNEKRKSDKTRKDRERKRDGQSS